MYAIPGRHAILALFILFLLLPIYWLINMSFKTNVEITSTMTLWPLQPTLANYRVIFTDPSWYLSYVNSLEYVVINTVLSVSLALPAAYAFSRYSFLGDKHLFFWLLTNRMAPAAVFALPFFNLYSAIGLFDSPLAVPLPASAVGGSAFFCFMFSCVELLLARTLTSVNAKPIAATMPRTVSAAGMDWGLLAAAGVLTIVPGAVVIWFVRNYIAKGFALGRV